MKIKYLKNNKIIDIIALIYYLRKQDRSHGIHIDTYRYHQTSTRYLQKYVGKLDYNWLIICIGKKPSL